MARARTEDDSRELILASEGRLVAGAAHESTHAMIKRLESMPPDSPMTYSEGCKILYRLQEYESKSNSSVVQSHDPSLKRLKATINQTIADMAIHPRHQELLPFYNNLLREFEAKIEPFIPLATGSYTPHDHRSITIHKAHEVTHVGHHAAHLIPHHLPHALEPHYHVIKKICGAAGASLPLVSFIIGLYKIAHDHELIHQARHLVGGMAKYRFDERQVLYAYLAAHLVHHYADMIRGDIPTTYFGTQDLEPRDKLALWNTFILGSLVHSLAHLEPVEHIDEFANLWIKDMQLDFKEQHSGRNIVKYVMRFNEDEFLLAKKVYFILRFYGRFEYPAVTEVLGKEFKLPVLDIDRKKFPLLYDIYHRVLKPYDKLAQTHMFKSFLKGYSIPDIEKLRFLHAKFYLALSVVVKCLSNKSFMDLRLTFINTIFVNELGHMQHAFPWHKEASILYKDVYKAYEDNNEKYVADNLGSGIDGYQPYEVTFEWDVNDAFADSAFIEVHTRELEAIKRIADKAKVDTARKPVKTEPVVDYKKENAELKAKLAEVEQRAVRDIEAAQETAKKEVADARAETAQIITRLDALEALIRPSQAAACVQAQDVGSSTSSSALGFFSKPTDAVLFSSASAVSTTSTGPK